MRNQVIISNVFADSNKGGAAITMATVDAVRQALPQSSICLVGISESQNGFRESHRFTLDAFPDVRIRGPIVPMKSGRFSGIRGFSRSLFMLIMAPLLRNSLINDVTDAKLVVSKGGHLFVERESFRRSLALWMTSLPLLLASRLKVPTAVVCTTIGPFTTWHSRIVSRWVLRRVDLVIARDEFSYKEGLKLGVGPSRLTQLPDIVFSVAPPSLERSDQLAKVFRVESKRFCAVTLCAPQDARFAADLRCALRQVIQRGHVEKVFVVPHAREDHDLSMEFARSCDHAAIEYLDADLSPQDLIAF
jgi:polysaccharide pyruvyl transferase WcaK-like protein